MVVIIYRKRYPGTPSFYKVIFKKFPDKIICTNADTSRNTKTFYWR